MEGTHHTRSAAQTMALGRALGDSLNRGAVVALVGELGAGKTCFVRGLARGLGIPDAVAITSPTFTVVNTYDQGRIPLYHFDLYRLADEDELEAIGYRDFVGTDGVAVLEWADKIPAALPDRYLEVVITQGARDNQRSIALSWKNC